MTKFLSGVVLAYATVILFRSRLGKRVLQVIFSQGDPEPYRKHLFK